MAAEQGRAFQTLGIDPGSNVTGYGIVEYDRRFRVVEFGVIRLPKSKSLAERLAMLYGQVRELVARTGVQTAAVEGVFMSKNWSSALKLGEARGAILAALAAEGVKVHEYSPAEIKRTVTGYGKAEKEQVREMIQVLTGLRERPTLDASDALAVAVTHAMLGGGR